MPGLQRLTHRDAGPSLYMLTYSGYIFVFAFLITITLIVMLLYSMSNQLSPFWFYSLIVTSCIYAYSYLKIGLSYPGFADPPSTQPSAATPMCETCGVVKSYGVYHCSDCNVCIEGYDHHCPWIGKCVGARNLCSFYFFLVMIFGTLVFCFVATLASASYREGKGAPGKTGHLVVAG